MHPLKSGLIFLGALLLLTAIYMFAVDRDSGRERSPKSGGAPPATRAGAPGHFDYYVLVLSWSPTHCASEDNGGDPQCAPGARHSFILHGLWPSYAQGWPEDCDTRTRNWVPREVIDSMRDVMPSKNLVIHEYRSHGTCSGLDAVGYFKLARELYDRVAIPHDFTTADRAQSMSPQEVERAFTEANSWMSPGMIEVTCRKRQLLDVRVCFNRDLSPRACGQNEARRSCRAASLTLPSGRTR